MSVISRRRAKSLIQNKFCTRNITWHYINLEACLIYSPPIHQYRHCLHTRNLNSDLNYLLIFSGTSMLDLGVNVNMTCNPWSETWDVEITYRTGGTLIYFTAQWSTVEHMTLSPAKFNLPKHKVEELPVYIRCTTLQLTLTVFHNKNLIKWDLMFGF